MTELLTATQMRAIEQAAIASGNVTGLELMERAGAGVVEAIIEEWPEFAARDCKAVVLCGPGNNGGDGFVVARLLAGLGWTVEVFLYGDADKLPPDARVNYERWAKTGGIGRLDKETAWAAVADAVTAEQNTVLIDAVFGTGLSRQLPQDLEDGLTAINDRLDRPDIRYLVIDVPSGLCADSGRIFATCPRRSDLTVTFHRAKSGQYLDRGQYCCGKIVVKDIGLNPWASDWNKNVRKGKATPAEDTAIGQDVPSVLLRPVHLTDDLNGLNKHPNDHKYAHGHALILSGPSGHTGAARLAARGALRIGAGLVTIGCPPDALAEHVAQLTSIMLKTIATPAEISDCLTDLRINALCLGPGMGVGAATRAMVAAALAAPAAAPGPLGARGPGAGPGLRCTVLDADALTSFAENPAELFALTHENTVLTPHGGEFARLFPDLANRLVSEPVSGPTFSKVDAAREAAARAGCVVLIKGPDTVIAHPDGRASINSAYYDRAAPWLATAGSGDVLAGFVTGLMARGFTPMQAAETAAWLHVECARSFGPGLIAEDLPEELPKVFRALGS